MIQGPLYYKVQKNFIVCGMLKRRYRRVSTRALKGYTDGGFRSVLYGLNKGLGSDSCEL